MQAIRQTQLLNRRELENATTPSASWHVDYRDTAWVYIGGLPLDLSEGDVITIFSQFGNPTHLNLIRDRETGKTKGFGFLKYEDQRSCDLAVDNLGGTEVLGRVLRVDHTRYKRKEGEGEDTWRIERLEGETEMQRGSGKTGGERAESKEERRRRKKRSPVIKEEGELERMLAIRKNGEDEDPMRYYLIKEKREDIERAWRREDDKERKHRHPHKHRDGEYEGDPPKKHSRRYGNEPRSKRDNRDDLDRSSRRHREDRTEGSSPDRIGKRYSSKTQDNADDTEPGGSTPPPNHRSSRKTDKSSRKTRDKSRSQSRERQDIASRAVRIK